MIHRKRRDAVFRAIADPTRREILSLLRGRQQTVGELAGNFRMSRPAISKHLRLLRSAGLVVTRQHGTASLCGLNAKPLRAINEWLRDSAPGMDIPRSLELSPIGYVHSPLKERSGAPLQGWEGAPNARLEIHPAFVECLDGLQPGQDIWIFTWLHEAQRSVLKVHPRGDVLNPLTGVFATRSPDRPNPIGLHRAKVLRVDGDRWLQVQGLEAIDGTPIIDIKPVLERSCDF